MGLFQQHIFQVAVKAKGLAVAWILHCFFEHLALPLQSLGCTKPGKLAAVGCHGQGGGRLGEVWDGEVNRSSGEGVDPGGSDLSQDPIPFFPVCSALFLSLVIHQRHGWWRVPGDPQVARRPTQSCLHHHYHHHHSLQCELGWCGCILERGGE